MSHDKAYYRECFSSWTYMYTSNGYALSRESQETVLKVTESLPSSFEESTEGG